jgi:hypothetical protein
MGWVARQKREYFFASLTQSGTQVEVKKYDINVNCMVRQGQLRATTVVTLRALMPNVTKHCFVLNSGLTVSSITRGETRLAFREREFSDVIGLKAVWVYFPTVMPCARSSPSAHPLFPRTSWISEAHAQLRVLSMR